MSLRLEPLSREAFAPFGEVVEVGGGNLISINDGTTTRHDDLAVIDVTEDDGRPVVSIFESRPFGFPLEIRVLERHPRGSQAFMPLDPHPYVVIVAPEGEGIDPLDIKVFLADGSQGVNYRRGVWHHPAIVIEPMRFLVVDRGTKEPNCDLFDLSQDGAPLILNRPDDG